MSVPPQPQGASSSSSSSSAAAAAGGAAGGAAAPPPVPDNLRGDEDLFAVFGLYEEINEGKFYRPGNKPLKHTMAKQLKDVEGPELETTLGKDANPIPGALAAVDDGTKIVPILAPVPSFELRAIRPELHAAAFRFAPGPPLEVVQAKKNKVKKPR